MQKLHDIAKVYGYGKIATYIDVYADLFEPLMDKNLKILEIGLHDGASMNCGADTGLHGLMKNSFLKITAPAWLVL